MKVLLIGLAGLVAQFGLAILGWGGFAGFFSHPQIIAIAVATLFMSVASLFSRGNLSPGEREDRGNRWVFVAFALLALLLAYVPAYCDRRDIWTIEGETVRWIGVVLFVLGGVLRLWPVFALGNRFSGLVAIQKGHTLLTTGIYRYIRNPSYLGMLVGVLGWALTFRSTLGVFIAALFLIPLISRINAEENLLSAQFGSEYENYRARSWRLIPGVY
jgi:protein-S-isoprenylcysteine O-methyltransferase Ste14